MADVVEVSNRWPLKKAPPPLVAVYVRACWGAETLLRQDFEPREIVHDKTGRCNMTAIYRVAKFMLRMARPYRRTEQALQIKWTIM